jgi:hypothetical protein
MIFGYQVKFVLTNPKNEIAGEFLLKSLLHFQYLQFMNCLIFAKNE